MALKDSTREPQRRLCRAAKLAKLFVRRALENLRISTWKTNAINKIKRHGDVKAWDPSFPSSDAPAPPRFFCGWLAEQTLRRQ